MGGLSYRDGRGMTLKGDKGWPHRRRFKWHVSLLKMRRRNRSPDMSGVHPAGLHFGPSISATFGLSVHWRLESADRCAADSSDPSMDSMAVPVSPRREVSSGARALWLRWPLKLNDFGHCAKINNKHKDMYNIWKGWITKVPKTWYFIMHDDKFGVRMSPVDWLLTHQFSTLPCGLEC